jgi:hypothetical protein
MRISSKHATLGVFLGLTLLAFAEGPSVVQITNLSATEVGLRCTGGGKLKARAVADMTIVSCAPSSEEKPAK